MSSRLIIARNGSTRRKYSYSNTRVWIGGYGSSQILQVRFPIHNDGTLSDKTPSFIMIKTKKPSVRRAHRAAWYRKTLGVSHEESLRLSRSLEGATCDICEENGPYLGIDHNHYTQKIRGILCKPCNSAIAFLKERQDLLDRAKAYLDRWS